MGNNHSDRNVNTYMCAACTFTCTLHTCSIYFTCAYWYTSSHRQLCPYTHSCVHTQTLILGHMIWACTSYALCTYIMAVTRWCHWWGWTLRLRKYCILQWKWQVIHLRGFCSYKDYSNGGNNHNEAGKSTSSIQIPNFSIEELRSAHWFEQGFDLYDPSMRLGWS